MKTSRFLRLALVLAIPAILAAQVPGGPRGIRDWWDSPVADGLNLTDAQRKQIQATTREFRNRLVDARGAVEKAEGDLQDFFNEPAPDQRRANEAIDRLASARGELTKVVSQMSLKLRGVLTPVQWQQLQQQRGIGRGPGRFDGRPDGRIPDGSPRGRRFGAPPPQPNAPPQQKGPNGPPPPGNPPAPAAPKPPAP